MKIRPLGAHVIIEPLDAPDKIGGIFMAEESKAEIEQRAVGMIIAIGPKVNEKLSEQGDKPLEEHQLVVYWKPGSGVIQGLNTQHYVYCTVDAIVGVVESDPHATAAEMKAQKDREAKFREERQAKILEERNRLALSGMANMAGRLTPS